MSETILKIEDLQVHYGGIEAVKGISFDVQAMTNPCSSTTPMQRVVASFI